MSDMNRAVAETLESMGSIHEVVQSTFDENAWIGRVVEEIGAEIGARLKLWNERESEAGRPHEPVWIAKKTRDELYRLVEAAMTGVNGELGNRPNAGW